MNKAEDYLDSLLNGDSTENGSEKNDDVLEKEFLDDFEKELNDDDMEDFIRDFELEIDGNEKKSEEAESENSFFDNIEGIVENAKIKTEEKDSPKEENISPKEETFEVDTLEEEFPSQEPEVEEIKVEDLGEISEEQKELMEMIEEIPVEEEFSDLNELLHSSQASADISEKPPKEKGGKKKEKEKGKETFLQKLSRILFGEDDEEELEEIQIPDLPNGMTAGGTPLSDEEMENLSEENRQILQELAAAEQAKQEDAADDKKGKKEKKKKEKKKKEKKPKEKKEKKEKKKKEPKPKKEKKPKKPKEVDLSPPLPKGPVILIFIMAISILALVLLSSDLLNYSANLSEAKEAMRTGSYVKAFETLNGQKSKEEDSELYEKTLLLARIQEELIAGDSLYQAGEYMMSLDGYVRALGRYEANYENATAYGIQAEYDALAKEAETKLEEQYHVSAQQAKEIYALQSREEYTKQLYTIVKSMGYAE